MSAWVQRVTMHLIGVNVILVNTEQTQGHKF